MTALVSVARPIGVAAPCTAAIGEHDAPPWLIYAPLLGATVLSKFSVPPLSGKGISLSFGIFAAAAALGVATSALRVHPTRFAWLLVTMSLLSLPQILRDSTFSLPSLLLLACAHVPYVLCSSQGGGVAHRTQEFFQHLCVALGICAIAQFLLQFVVPVALLFPIENFVPQSFVVQLFNQQAPLDYGSTLYRANGVFMIEPSLLSQLLAVALIVELCGSARLWRLGIHALALVFTYSGTGIMILAVCVPVVIVALRRWHVLALLAGGLLVLALLRDRLFLDLLLSRSSELSATGSSGFARFVGGFWLFDQYLWQDPVRTLIGFGAGAFTDYAPLSRTPVSEMPLFKLVFEFGVLGTALYVAFLGYCVFATTAALPIRLAIFIALMLNGLSNPFAHGLAFGLLVWSMSCPADPPASPATREMATQRPVRRRRWLLAWRGKGRTT